MDQDRAFIFHNDIGDTYVIAASTVSAELKPPLRPGRYIVHVPTQSDAAALAWVCVSGKAHGLAPDAAFVAAPVSIGVTRGRVALSANGLRSIPIHVRVDHNDRIAVILSAGTGSVHVTRVSR